jgi:heme/copper-type cytochrome/quinol oxidase subunit 2
MMPPLFLGVAVNRYFDRLFRASTASTILILILVLILVLVPVLVLVLVLVLEMRESKTIAQTPMQSNPV